MLKLYMLIFWIPAAAAAISLRLCWSEGLLSRPFLALAWFAGALLLQIKAHFFSPLWAVGLALQTVLAVTLALKWKLGH